SAPTVPTTIAPTDDQRVASSTKNRQSTPAASSIGAAMLNGPPLTRLKLRRSPPSVTRYQPTGTNTIAISRLHQCAAARELGPSSKSLNGSSSPPSVAVRPVVVGIVRVVPDSSAGSPTVATAPAPAAASGTAAVVR